MISSTLDMLRQAEGYAVLMRQWLDVLVTAHEDQLTPPEKTRLQEMITRSRDDAEWLRSAVIAYCKAPDSAKS